MTNFEKYKDIILKTAKEGEAIHPAMVGGELTDCMNTACTSCDFAGKGMECDSRFIEWLYEKFEPKPKKTRQSEFLKLFPNTEKKLAGDTEIIAITPCTLLKRTNLEAGHCAPYNNNRCLECMKDYWLTEVE